MVQLQWFGRYSSSADTLWYEKFEVGTWLTPATSDDICNFFVIVIIFRRIFPLARLIKHENEVETEPTQVNNLSSLQTILI